MGDLARHEGADLPSVSMAGGAMAGAKAPIMGALRMAQAGRPERDTFTGTDEQLTAQQTRQESAAAREQARQDRIAALAEAAQARKDAQASAQQGREDLVRLAASLRPPTSAQVAAQTAAAAAPAAAEKQQNEVQDSLNLIKQIREDKALGSSTGPIEGRGAGFLVDPEGYTRVKALHDNLVNKLALAQTGKMKGQGAISNFERDMLAKAATALQMKLGDADYLNELAKVETQFQRMLKPAATTTPSGGKAPAKGGFSVVEIK
jgi:hypothetical protein